MKPVNKQLDEWVQGNPMHNFERNECCPDFSCCRGKDKISPQDVRERFAKAFYAGDTETVNQMLMMFLSGAISEETGKTPHIAGEGDLTPC